MARAGIYLETDVPRTERLGYGVQVFAADSKSDARYEFAIDGKPVILNVMREERISEHLRGFCGYVSQLQAPESLRQEALARISRVRCVLGLMTEAEFDTCPSLWNCLRALAAASDGFVFTSNSIYLPTGEVLVGPMRV